MEIREMDLRDIPQVMIIEKQNFSVPWTAEDYADYVKREDTLMLSACTEDTVLGYCGVILIPDEGEITNVSVSRSAQGKGIGTELVREMIRRAAEKGCVNLFLEVRESNRIAQTLYAHAGFCPVGVRKNYYDRPQENAIVMKREGISQELGGEDDKVI